MMLLRNENGHERDLREYASQSLRRPDGTKRYECLNMKPRIRKKNKFGKCPSRTESKGRIN